MSDVLGVRLPPNAGPWGVGAGRLGSRLRFRSTGRAWERKGSSGGSSSHLLAQPERHWALPSGWEICRWGPPRWGALRGSRLEAWLSSPTKVLGKERNPFPKRGVRKVSGLPRGASKGLSPQSSSRTELYLTGETGLPSFTAPFSPIRFPLQPCSPWGSWAAPPIVGVGTGKGQRSHRLSSSWERSSS